MQSKSPASPPAAAPRSTGFRPLDVAPMMGRPLAADLRYAIYVYNNTPKRPVLNLFVTADLCQRVKPQPKGWRLDVDPVARRGRLSALIEMDRKDLHQQCKKHVELGGKGLSLRWPWLKEAVEMFPDFGKITALQNVTVTSMGIEFDLPQEQKKGGRQ